MSRIIAKHWFLTALGLVLVTGVFFADALEPITFSVGLRQAIVAAVLFITALPLPLSEFGRAIRRPWAAALAVALNSLVLPLVAWPISCAFPKELALGLMAAAAAPGTLASAAVWTRRAGGNDLIAIIVTVITNLSCFVVTPLWILVATGRNDVRMDLEQMVTKLAALVVFPMVAAQLFRRFRRVAAWTSGHRGVLATLAQIGVLAMVMIGAVQCGLQMRTGGIGSGGLSRIIAIAATVLGIHLVMAWLGYRSAEWMGFPRADRIGVAFSGSQKTLMVGLQVSMMLGGGLVILPIVFYHILQLVADTLIADRFAASDRPRQPHAQS